jgi:hypothetical protein
MPIRYDAVLVRALAAELTRRLSRRRLEELHFDREERRLRLVLAEGEELVWLLHPASGYLLQHRAEVSTGRRKGRSRGILPGARELGEVTAGADERRLVFDLGGESLVVELHTNQWNALFLGGASIRQVLWPRRAGGRSLFSNAPYIPPGGARKWSGAPPSASEWSAWWNSQAEPVREAVLVREIAWTSRLNAGFLLSAAPSADAVRARLLELHPGASAELPATGSPPDSPAARSWLLRRASGLQPYPLSLEEEESVPTRSLLAAMRASAEDQGLLEIERVESAGVDTSGTPPARRGEVASDREDVDRLEMALRRRLVRARKRTAALRRQLEEGDGSAELRAAGQLLLARKSEVPRGSDSVRLPGFDGGERTIVLDPALDAIQNAERFFDRARRRARAERELPARIAEARAREAELSAALEDLATEGASERLWRQAGGRVTGPGAAGHRRNEQEPARLPYRRLRSAGGLEIRVGRSARGNDDLTFRHSAPDDIWLHARQAPGAHVILRWGDREQNPPEKEIRAAALVAAEYSDARFSGLVPVDWTRRKYVRKPRKSAPGAVIPDRIQTIFVEPDPARVREMMEAGPDAP